MSQVKLSLGIEGRANLECDLLSTLDYQYQQTQMGFWTFGPMSVYFYEGQTPYTT